MILAMKLSTFLNRNQRDCPAQTLRAVQGSGFKVADPGSLEVRSKVQRFNTLACSSCLPDCFAFRSWFDKLTTNGIFFNRFEYLPVRPEPVEGRRKLLRRSLDKDEGTALNF